MRIAICANKDQQEEWLGKKFNNNIEVVWFNKPQQKIANFDVYFDLLFNESENAENIFIRDITVFANAVATTTTELPENYVRINAWKGFLSRTLIEVAASNIIAKEKASIILKAIGWNFIWAPDEPGMIAGRVISMIINEAYFALEENISTKEEIDIAMKLGTNYPYGPFEWSTKIGLQNVYTLLKKLNNKEIRYQLAPLMMKEFEDLKNVK